MKVRKTVLAKLNKCYAVAPLLYRGKRHFLVAAEREDPCCLFASDGALKDVLWTGPGGVMSMVQVPGTDGQLLATAKFYSPDESPDAELVVVTPAENGRWDMRCLTKLPHVHRFDILTRNGVNWLLACTVKSGQDLPEGDWRYPGKVYAAVLPADLSGFDEDHPLQLQLVKDGLHRNHGYPCCWTWMGTGWKSSAHSPPSTGSASRSCMRATAALSRYGRLRRMRPSPMRSAAG